MNEVLKTIYGRRAVRKYLDKPVPNEILEQLIDAGRMAPSAINRQPWRFVVVTKKEDIQLFSKEIRRNVLHELPKLGIKNIVKGALSGISHLAEGLEFVKEEDPVFHGAPLVIFISAPKDNEWAGLDIGMCAQNIMLTARSLGLESCPVGFGKFVMGTPSYARLHIPDNENILLAVVIGFGNERPETHARKKDNITYL